MDNKDLEINKTEDQDDQMMKKCCKKRTCSSLSNPNLANALSAHVGENTMVVLKANQLNILNQVFRPIFVGKIEEVSEEFVLMKDVNIKMNQAPEFVFPTPLMIPLNQIAWYVPFDPATRISLY